MIAFLTTRRWSTHSMPSLPDRSDKTASRNARSGGRRRAVSRGQALVELALILPVFLVLFASALDLGRLFYGQITITNSAREAALEAARNPGSFQANAACDATLNRIMCRAIHEADGSFVTVTPGDVSLTCSTSPCPPTTPAIGSTIAIRVQGRFSLLTPLLTVFLGGQTLTISSTATAQMNVTPTVAAVATPTPTPSPTPTVAPTATPIPTATPVATPIPTPTPVPTPTPACLVPSATISVNPTNGKAANNGGNQATNFAFAFGATNMGVASCSPVWSWNFGDGSGTSTATTTTAPAPTHAYAHAWAGKTVTVTLTASNAGGTSAPVTVQIPLN